MRKPKNNIFSELYFDQYEVSVNAKNIRYFEVEEHPLIKVICSIQLIAYLNFQDFSLSHEILVHFFNLQFYIFIAGNCE